MQKITKIDSNKRYLVALYHIVSQCSNLALKLYNKFHDLEELFSLSSSQLKQLNLPDKLVLGLKNPPWDKVDQTLAWQEHSDQSLLFWQGDNYPERLAEIIPAPLLLFVKGDAKLLKEPQLSIVGSRGASFQGLENSFNFSYELSKTGFVITSGLALGVDTESHKGALLAGGKTVAVLGSGIDLIYPHRNQKLAAEIVEKGGALVSEFPLQTKPRPINFPQRNRIISGLSLGTLVVEAAERSGSLITARLALEQNREVFAIPGSIYDANSAGTNALIKQGAKLVSSIDDILVEFEFATQKATEKLFFQEEKSTKRRLNSVKKRKKTDALPRQDLKKLDFRCEKLLKCVDFEPTSIDLIATRSGFSILEINELTVELELLGLIERGFDGIKKVPKR